jgi:EVE domain
MTKQKHFWIAVASAEHARHGRDIGIMQVGHGKGPPLRRISPGDGIVYYAPAAKLGGKDGLQSFVSIGHAKDDRIYQADMGGGFTPFRRDVAYAPAQDAAIRPLLDKLELTRDKASWGYVFRFGLIEISEKDFRVIAAAMQASV